MKTNNLSLQGKIIASPNNEETYRRHLNEIAKYRPLSREEESETFKLIKLGDQRAIDKICKHNLLFVVSVAKRYSVMLGASSTLTLEDLISEGNMGLFIAINKFNPEEGNKFISYAVWWIKQCILASIQNNIKNIRIPSSVRSELNKINRKEQQLTQLYERAPSSIEIFEAMVDDGEMTQYINKVTIDELIKISNFETSLSNLIGHDSVMELGDMIVSEDPDPAEALIDKQRKELLMAMLGKLPRHAKNYLIDFYGIDTYPLTLKQMGEKYDLTPEAIRQTINKYTRRLKATNRIAGNFFFPTPDYEFKKQFPDFDRNARYLI